MIWHRMDEGGLSMCEYGYGRCTTPDTRCHHWIGTFCELDETNEGLNALRRAKNSLCGECEKFDHCEQAALDIAKCLANLEDD